MSINRCLLFTIPTQLIQRVIICAYACIGILVLDAREGSPAQKAGLRSTVRTAAGGIALG